MTVVDGRAVGLPSSHADRARIVRGADPEGDARWARRSVEALAGFPALEAAPGAPRFFTRCGALVLGPRDFVERACAASGGGGREQLQVTLPGTLAERWPYLAPAQGCSAAAFDSQAGVMDPLAFCRAQYAAAAALDTAQEEEGEEEEGGGGGGGAEWRVVPGEAVRVAEGLVELRTGEVLRGDRVVVCGGAGTRGLLEGSGLLPRGEMDGVRVSRRTVALLEVSADCAGGLLRNMPSVKYAFRDPAAAAAAGGGGEQSRVEGSSVYVLPPVQYPERGGRWFVKVGGGPNDWMDPPARGLAEWLASSGDSASASWLEGVLRRLMPGVPFLGCESMACVTTISEAAGGDVLLLDLGGGVAAVSACQGKGAGPADAVGAEVAARLLRDVRD